MSRNKKYKMMPISSNFTEKSGYRAQFVGDGYSIDGKHLTLVGDTVAD